MRILYQIPSLETIYAAKFIYLGYKSAFEEDGHAFRPLTANDDLRHTLESFEPDIFITSLNEYNLKFLDLSLLKKFRENGMRMFTQIRPWKTQTTQYGAVGLSECPSLIKLIKENLAGDVFFHWLEQDDPFMDGFEKETGYPFHTILLAADKCRFFYEYDKNFACDISFVGNYLPRKKAFIDKHLTPLKKQYSVNIYGNDWTFFNRILGFVQKGGQYLNIPYLKQLRTITLPLEDEHKVFSSSLISLNIHEEHQRKYGSDFNERTFKIIASGGFEICDHVKGLRKYFSEEELVIAENTEEWYDKISFFIQNPEKRKPFIEKGMCKVMSEHTYHNRIQDFFYIYHNL